MQVLSESETISVSGGFSTFEITMSTTIWGAIISVWKGSPVWLICGLTSGIVLSATKVVDDYLGYGKNNKEESLLPIIELPACL